MLSPDSLRDVVVDAGHEIKRRLDAVADLSVDPTSVVGEKWNSLKSSVSRVVSEASHSSTDHFWKRQLSGGMLSLEQPTFRAFAVAAGVLGAKLVFNSGLTVFYRTTRKVYSTPEDLVAFGEGKATNDDPVVERIRRMHQNDLENITPFFILGLVYVATNPDPKEADILFKSFVASRLLHTVSHVVIKTQPARFLFFAGGFLVNAFLAFRVFQSVVLR